MTNLNSIIKSRDITLPTKVCLVKTMVFPVVMYGCASWTIKKAEHWRIAAFELWCWGRLLRVPWTAKRSNQFILKETVLGVHWKDWCWSWNCNTLATWCKELTHWKRPWCWEGLGQEEKGTTEDEMAWWHHWCDGHGFGWFQELVVGRGAWCAVVHGATESGWLQELVVGRGPGVLQSVESQRVGHDWAVNSNSEVAHWMN